ncbi:hypothetical protein TrVE_jg4673 [Triparma verrucosa]|uniref:USP domain-containing protein n=1 Tax=Triparma verrucosa TaxID=1606542 RepID=A0A9W7BGZ8_9STRA|nr:hypothetical protein TrVE_jg4673 [Triparma verrucosa]
MPLLDDHELLGSPESDLADTRDTPAEGLAVYNKVKDMLTRISKVGWNESTVSIKYAANFLETCPAAQEFSDGYLKQIVSILLDQEHVKLQNLANTGGVEKKCVEDSLSSSVQLIATALAMAVADPTRLSPNPQLLTLAQIFDPNRIFYVKPKHAYGSTQSNDNFRKQLIKTFLEYGGAENLAKYLSTLVSSGFDKCGVEMDHIALLVDGLDQALKFHVKLAEAEAAVANNNSSVANPSTPPRAPAASVANLNPETPPPTPASPGDLNSPAPPPSPAPSAPMAAPVPTPLPEILQKTVNTLTSQILKTELEVLKILAGSLLKLSNSLESITCTIQNSPRPPEKWYTAFAFPHIKILLDSNSLNLKLHATTMLTNLTVQSTAFKPPPSSYIVEGAGLEWVNGEFQQTNAPGDSLKYTYSVQNHPKGKKIDLTLFQCSMRSQCKWWFISEADPDQPGTDKDIDYYQHKSTKTEEAMPPKNGWSVSKGHDKEKRDPPPTLTAIYSEETKENLETWLKAFVARPAVWDACCDGHREVVRRGGEVVKWMSEVGGIKETNLDGAWKNCVAKGVSVESAEILQILTSIIDTLAPDLALHLLSRTKQTLNTNKTNNVEIVVDFLEFLGNKNAGATKFVAPEVNAAIMDLLWSTLTHSSVPQKSYVSLLNYFLSNLTPAQISEYLARCTKSLTSTSSLKHPLKIIQITHALLKAAPTDDVIRSTELPKLLFEELLEHVSKDKPEGLKERLDVARFVFGKTEEVNVTFEQLKSCWDLTSNPEIKNHLLSFLSSGSNFNPPVYKNNYPTAYNGVSTSFTTSEPLLLSCFESSVAKRAFEELVCKMDWEKVEVESYKSFKEILEGVRPAAMLKLGNSRSLSSSSNSDSDVGLDSLWQIALTASSTDVVSEANSDLLQVYTQEGKSDSADAFVSRVFSYLSSSKGSKLTISRCVQLLCGAVRCGEESQYESITYALATMDSTNCRGVFNSVPHVLRSAACTAPVNIVVKRLPGGGGSHSRDSVATGAPAPAPSTKVTKEVFQLQLHPLETLDSIRHKVAMAISCHVKFVKPITVSGKRSKENEQLTTLSQLSYSTTVSELSLCEGSELTFLAMTKESSSQHSSGKKQKAMGDHLDVISLFLDSNASSKYFLTLFSILEKSQTQPDSKAIESLIWDFLLAVPTNQSMVSSVKAAAGLGISMDDEDTWASLLNVSTIHKSVYTMQVIDFLLQPADELFNSTKESNAVMDELRDVSIKFKKGFVETGGFQALLTLFLDRDNSNVIRGGMGNAVALRILKFCLFDEAEAEQSLLKNIKDSKPLLIKLASAALSDSGDSVVIDAVEMLRLLLQSADNLVQDFVKLPKNIAEDLVTKLLLRAGSDGGKGGMGVRRAMLTTVIDVPQLGTVGFPWLLKCLDGLSIEDEHVGEFFGVLQKLVKGAPTDNPKEFAGPSAKLLVQLGIAACKKLLSLSTASPLEEFSTSQPTNCTAVLNGCLLLIRKLLETKVPGGGESSLVDGCKAIQKVRRSNNVIDKLAKKVARLGLNSSGSLLCCLVDLLFEDFLFAMGGKSKRPICSTDESRKLAFNVAAAIAKASPAATLQPISSYVSTIVSHGEPGLRNRWAFMIPPIFASNDFKGLRNQGCTCYMNSLLQQLYMMKDVRESICGAKLPERSGGAEVENLVGKRLQLWWENGSHYEAEVQKFDAKTGMHTINYVAQTNTALPAQNTNYGQNRYHNYNQPVQTAQDIEDLKLGFSLEERVVELHLSTGRVGRESGNYIVKAGSMAGGEQSGEGGDKDNENARKMLEELQKTFVSLSSTTSPAYNPRSLVSTSSCLKLEFDVYQQNDAAEYQTKLFDKLEGTLGKYDKKVGKEITNRFQAGTTMQKICRECGLKTNNAEQVCVNVEIPVRGKTEIHEGLDMYCSEELMSGDNKVMCEKCDKKTDTLLRTSMSKFPRCLTVSLKRFDLDYEIWETVKLNSRFEFGLNLNLKQYSIEGREAIDKYVEEMKAKLKEEEQEKGDDDEGGKEGAGKDGPRLERASSFGYDPNASGSFDPLSTLPDEDWEYKLAGVLVHAGVAGGGHYYSFIKDRDSSDWFKFDDEDVTPFDVSRGEEEWFGGKVMKETKWQNGAVNMVETERYANAMMLFYEKVKVDDDDDDGDRKKGEVKRGEKEDEEEEEDEKEEEPAKGSSGYDAYLSAVHAANDTHVRNSYLFDTELNIFLHQLLTHTPTLEVLKLCVNFFFDTFIHGVCGTKAVEQWRDAICRAIEKVGGEAADWLVREVAGRVQSRLSGSWLNHVAKDSTSSTIRQAGLEMISTAMHIVVRDQTEASKLTVWTESWKKQTTSIQMMGDGSAPYPSKLENNLRTIEDFQGAAGSAIGVILSAVNELTNNVPTFWKASIELLEFIGGLVMVKGLREACLASHMHVRLLSCIVRANAPEKIRAAFPGPTMSAGVVERLRGGGLGGVGQHAQHMTFAGQFGGVPENDIIRTCLAAVAGILGVPGARAKSLHGSGVTSANPSLTKDSVQAFKYIFDACRGDCKGMDLQAILTCMDLCKVEKQDGYNHQIKNILNQYATETVKGGAQALTLEGFLKYHSDTAKKEESRVREDLNVFGFRRDLSRREFVDVVTNVDGKVKLTFEPTEAAARDIFENAGGAVGGASGSEMSEALASSVDFWRVAFGVDVGLSSSCLAAFWLNQDSTTFINEVLTTMVEATGQWNANDTAELCGRIFEAIVGLPDAFQQERMRTIFYSTVEVKGLQLGIFNVAREYAQNTVKWGLTNEESAYMYINIVRSLRKNGAVVEWMGEEKRRPAWAWMDRVLNGEVGARGGAGAGGGGRSGDDDVAVVAGGGVGVQPIGGFVDSDDETDLGVINLMGAGVEACNGRYGHSGTFDRVGKWTKEAVVNGATVTMCVYRCKLDDDSRRWFVSVIPKGQKPGTNRDVDYYGNSSLGEGFYPPTHGWTAVTDTNGAGMSPGPIISFGGIDVDVVGGLGDSDSDAGMPDLLGEGGGVGDLYFNDGVGGGDDSPPELDRFSNDFRSI